MPTVFSHAVVAAALGAALPRDATTRRDLEPDRRFGRASIVALGVACAVLPDADVLAFTLGIPYEHPLGHRGLSHSLAFAAVVASLVVGLALRRAIPHTALWLYFFLATASHGLLDMLTDGGHGIALFGPLWNERLFFPWRPIEVSPLGLSRFFSQRGLEVMASELVWIWAPSLVFVALTVAVRRSFRASR